MSPRDRRRLVPWIAAAALLFGVGAIAIALTGGFHVPLGPIAVSSRKASRPAIIALLLAALSIWLLEPRERAALRVRWMTHARAIRWWVARTWDSLPRARWWALVLAAASGIAAWTYGSQTAGGSDAFAYVSQAALLRTGGMALPVPLASRAPWPEAAESFAPLGYRARSDGTAVVPITAPGVPLLMAVLQLAGGHRAAFLVAPVAAALAVWFTFLIGLQVRSGGAGLAAAWLVATSPAFLFNSMWPVSDVAACMFATLLVTLLLRQDLASTFLAGLAGSMGLLTRPNFALLDAAVLGWLAVVALIARNRSSVLRSLVFPAGLIPGATLQAWLNLQWFGRAVASGYGSPEELLSIERADTNAMLYATWLLQTSPLLVVGFVAMVVPLAWLWGREPWRVPLLFALLSIATVSVYLLYTTFDAWWYLRFLLPVWPLAAVATAIVAGALSDRSRTAGAVAAALIVVAGVRGLTWAESNGAFRLGIDRYATVAALVAGATEPTAIVITVAHSGSVRYYAGRETVRFNAIDPVWLDRAIEWLRARGRRPYILLEDWELPEFRSRFGASSTIGRLDFAPAATWESSQVAGRVFLFDPVDRDRFATADPGIALEHGMPRSAPSRFPKLAYE